MQFRLAQKDTQASLKLAAAAKRDSSSMNVIALLTTLFLPGAFVGVSTSPPLNRDNHDEDGLLTRFSRLY
jgi:hypothetical protein